MSISLPPVSTLWNDTFRVVKSSWLRILGVLFLAGLIVSVFVVALLALLVTTSILPISQIVAPMQPKSVDITSVSTAVSLWGSARLGAGGLLAVIGTLVLSFFLLAMSATVILVADDAYKNSKRSMGDMINQAIRRTIPWYFASLVTGFLVLGAFNLLIVPAIIFSILFTFTNYEVVINELSPINAVRESVRVVKSAFWAVAGRILLFAGIGFLLDVVLRSLRNESSPVALLLGYILYGFILVVNIVFSIVLYRQAKLATKNAPKASLFPFVILSIIGYIVGALFWVAIIGFAFKLSPEFSNPMEMGKNGTRKQMQQIQIQNQNMPSANETDLGAEPTSPEGQELLNQLDELQKQMQASPTPKGMMKMAPTSY